MANLLHKLGFRKMDELELQITLHSLKWENLFATLLLAGWSCWELLFGTRQMGTALSLVIIVKLVTRFVAQAFYTKKMVGEGDEE